MKIETKNSGKFATGYNIKLSCEGVDISKLVTHLNVEVAPDSIVAATVDVCVTDLQIDGARLVINNVEAPEEVVEAFREYFAYYYLFNQVVAQAERIEYLERQIREKANCCKGCV